MDEREESGDNGRFGVANSPEIPGMIVHLILAKDDACIDFRHLHERLSVRPELYVTRGVASRPRAFTWICVTAPPSKFAQQHIANSFS